MSGNIWVALPLACLAGGAFGVYLIARLVTRNNGVLAAFTASIFAAALATLVVLQSMVHVTSLPSWGHFSPGGAFLRADPGATVIASIALGLGLLVSIYSGRYLALDRRYETYYPLLLLLTTGLVGMLLAADLFNLYMFCELMSLTAYALVAFRRRTRTAIEAGFKYLVMGSVGTIIMLMGIALVYRESGQLTFPQAASAFGVRGRAGIACLLVGLGIKSAIVPMHTWLPDAHGRAPSSISAMLSGVIVQSVFYTLLKVCLGLGMIPFQLGTLLIFLGLLNMTIGNSMALVQMHTKRLLAYSTIAQMGSVMLSIGIGLRYDISTAIQAGLFVILTQAVMKGLAFLCKGVCHFYRDATTIQELRGTADSMPGVAVAFGAALVGLAGVPPLAGFAGKWFVVLNVLKSLDVLGFIGLTIFLLNTLLALGYYLPLLGVLFTPHREGKSERVYISPWMSVSIGIMAILTLTIGLYPGPWMRWMDSAGAYILTLAR